MKILFTNSAVVLAQRWLVQWEIKLKCGRCWWWFRLWPVLGGCTPVPVPLLAIDVPGWGCIRLCHHVISWWVSCLLCPGGGRAGVGASLLLQGLERSLLALPYFFSRGAKPRAVPLAGGQISTPSFSLPSLAPSCAWWPNFRCISKVLGKLYLGFLALDFPGLLLCCLFAFLNVMFQAQPCAFLEVWLTYMNGSQKVQLKSSFSSWEQPGTTSVWSLCIKLPFSAYKQWP